MGSNGKQPVHVIGGGLAGSEAAWQMADRGIKVVLHEMRPVRMTDAHKSAALAELNADRPRTNPAVAANQRRRLSGVAIS